MYVAPPDANDRFLCTYGAFRVSYYRDANSGSFHETWTHVAVPITGRGKTVSRIVLEEKKNAKSHDGKFSAGIYSNTASGLPGNMIAGGAASATGRCATVEIPISPLQLQAKQTYWIVEQAYQQGNHLPRDISWVVDPATKRKAYVQRHSSSSASRYTSPWKEQSQGPYVRVK